MDPNQPSPSPSSQYPMPPSPPPRRAGMGAGLLLVLGCFGFMALGLAAIVLLVAIGGEGSSGGSSSVDDRSVLRIKLGGEVPEYVRSSGFDDVFGGAPVTVRQHVFNLEKAAKDTRIKGVLLELDPMATGWGKIEELRDAIVTFKKSGKFVVVFSEYLSEKEYALALAADTIVMPKDSFFEFNGLATDIGHYPGLLEKLGIEVQYFRYGKYKSISGEQSGRKAFTEPVKEMIHENMELTFTHFVDAVASYRKLDAAEVRKLIDEGHHKADWALEQKLIDQLGYYDEVETLLRQKVGLTDAKEKLHFVSAGKYRNVSPEDAGLEEGKHSFALIYSTGLIVSGKGGGGGLDGEGNQGSEPLIQAIRKAVDDDDIKAIIFRVDSPGGAGMGCDYVRREIARAREKKPVVVSMSDVAASGGYWVSMDATAIVAQPTTMTGSIGIYTVVPNFAGLWDKMGLNNEIFKVGAHADSLTLARGFTEEEAKQWDADLFTSYNRFVSLAAEGRKMELAKMEEVAQGRTWLGAQAKEKGLVDALGGFPVAIEVAREKAHLPTTDTISLKLFDKKRTLFESLTNRDEEEDEADLAPQLLAKLVEASGLKPMVQRVPGLSGLALAVLSGRYQQYPMLEYSVDFH